MVHSNSSSSSLLLSSHHKRNSLVDEWNSMHSSRHSYYSVDDDLDDDDEFSTMSVTDHNFKSESNIMLSVVSVDTTPTTNSNDCNDDNNYYYGVRFQEDAPSYYTSALTDTLDSYYYYDNDEMNREEVLRECWYSADDYQRFKQELRADARVAIDLCNVRDGDLLAIGYSQNLQQSLLPEGQVILRQAQQNSQHQCFDNDYDAFSLLDYLVGLERYLTRELMMDKMQRRRDVVTRVLHAQCFYATWDHEDDQVADEALREASLSTSRTSVFTAYCIASLAWGLRA